MNILTCDLPKDILIGNSRYAINYDFKTWLKFEKLAFSFNNSPEEAIYKIFKLCFRFNEKNFMLPPSWQEALTALMMFYSSEKSEYGKKINAACKSKRIFSFEHDSSYIYSAFMQQYNIDLCKSNLHWWQFKALFGSLTDDTKMGAIMKIRALDLSNVSDKNQKNYYRRLKRLYALPDLRSDEQKENDIAEALSKLL